MAQIFHTAIPYLLLVFFICLLTIQRHMMNFRGSSKTYHSLLSINVSLCSIAILVFLVCWGIQINSWWIPVVTGAGGIMLSSFVQGTITVFIPEYVLSIISMVSCPALLIVMFVINYI